MSTLDLSIIGNGNINALLDPRGKIVWSCLPRFDSDPIFCDLLIISAFQTPRPLPLALPAARRRGGARARRLRGTML